MKKVKKILILIFSLIFLVSCSKDNKDKKLDIDSTIREPKNNSVPMEGVWKVVKIYEGDKNLNNLPSFSLNDNLYVSKKLVAIGDSVSISPSFSSKMVKERDYFESKFMKLPSDKDGDKNVKVLMVRDGDKFSMDLTISDEKHAFIIYESRIYYLEKSEDKVPEEIVEKYREYASIKERKEVNYSGKPLIAFIGVHEEKQTNTLAVEHSYSTYMIYDDGSHNKPIVNKIKGIYIPSLENKSAILNYEHRGVGKTDDMSSGVFSLSSAEEGDKTPVKYLNVSKGNQITYVGNGMVSFKYLEDKHATFTPIKYEIRSLDKFSKEPLRIEDIADESEVEAFKEQIRKIVTDYEWNNKGQDKIDTSNIGVERRRNVWSFVTSFFGKRSNKDYMTNFNVNINTTIPIFDSKVEDIDEKRFKNRFPDIDTVSLSPDERRALVKTKDEIHYLSYLGDELPDDPILSIQISSKSDIVSLTYFSDKMAEQEKQAFLKLNLSQPQVIYNKR